MPANSRRADSLVRSNARATRGNHTTHALADAVGGSGAVSFRWLLRVETRAPSCRPIRRADSLVRSNARTTRGNHTTHALADAVGGSGAVSFRWLLRVETRAPSCRPILARGQSCPQQRTHHTRQPHNSRAGGRGGRFERREFSVRCCGLKPALRHAGQFWRADSLVRSNARATRGNRTTHALADAVGGSSAVSFRGVAAG